MSGYGFSAGYHAEDRRVGWNRADTNLDQSWILSPVGNWNSITENAAMQNRTTDAFAEQGQKVMHQLTHEIINAKNMMNVGGKTAVILRNLAFACMSALALARPFKG